MYPAWFVFALGIGVSVVGLLVGVLIILAFTQWLDSQSHELQHQSQSIKRLDADRVYVELRALKRDEQGYFIPGYGRILQTWQNAEADPDPDPDPDPLQGMPEVKKWKGKVAFICHERTRPETDIKEYVIAITVPL